MQIVFVSVLLNALLSKLKLERQKRVCEETVQLETSVPYLNRDFHSESMMQANISYYTRYLYAK